MKHIITLIFVLVTLYVSNYSPTTAKVKSKKYLSLKEMERRDRIAEAHTRSRAQIQRHKNKLKLPHHHSKRNSVVKKSTKPMSKKVINHSTKTAVKKPTRQLTDFSKIPVPKIGYKEIVKEMVLPAVCLSSNDTKTGRIQRAWRWQNIVRVVEKRYGIPKDYLLGMICVESEGDPTQPNSGDDGGVGLIHMQPSTASGYGLDLITDSKKLVDHAQGKKIRSVISAEDGDLKELIQYDDRFHPIKNIDAAARMLCDLHQSRHSWTKALEGFSGRKSYDSKVLQYVMNLQSKKFMNNIHTDFSIKNQGATFRDKQITFDSYINYFHEQNKNYGLSEYSKLKQYRVGH